MSKKSLILSLVKKPRPQMSSRRRRSPPLDPLTIDVLKTLKSDGCCSGNSLEAHLSGKENDVVSRVARQVFDKMHDDPVTAVGFFHYLNNRPYTCPIHSRAYSSLLKLLAASRSFPDLEKVFLEMENREVYPTQDAVQSLIREYSLSGDVDSALRFYSYLIHNLDSAPAPFTSNSLLAALVRSGRTHLALPVYHQIAKLDSGQIAKMDLSFLPLSNPSPSPKPREPKISRIFENLEKESPCMEEEEVVMVNGSSMEGIPGCEITKKGTKRMYFRAADDHTTGIMVKALCDEGRVEEGRRLISERWGPHVVPNIVFYNILIDGCARKGSWRKVKLLLTELNEKGFVPNIKTYAPVVSLLSRLGRLPALAHVVSEMRARGLHPNAAVYNSIIHALRGDRARAMAVVGAMTRHGCAPDRATFTTLVAAASRSGDTRLAETLLGRHPCPDLLSSTSLLHALLRDSDPDGALDLLRTLPARPDPVLYGAVVHGLVSAGHVEPALTVLDLMKARRVPLDLALYNSLLAGLFSKGMFSKARALFSEMLARGLTPDEYVSATAVYGLARSGRLIEARDVFETAVQSGRAGGPCGAVVVYNAMIKGLCGVGEMKEARVCLARMRRVGVRPDVVTYSTLIDGFVKTGDIATALCLFGGMMRRGCRPNVVSYTSIVEGFCRRGESARAEGVVRCMRAHGVRPNVITYAVLIRGTCREGRPFKAVETFRDMLADGCVPSDGIFQRLFNVVSFSEKMWIVFWLCKYGKVEEALDIRRKIERGDY